MITLPLNLARIVMGHVLKGRFNAVKQLSQFLGRKSSGSLMRESQRYLKNAKKKGMPHTPITGRYIKKYQLGWKDKFRTPTRFKPRKEWADYLYEEIISNQFAKPRKAVSDGRVLPLAQELIQNNKFAKELWATSHKIK